jgi:signal transduction histidine kinase
VKCAFFFFLHLLLASSLFGQADTSSLIRIYNRAMHLTGEKTDSIGYYADYLNRAYLNGQYPKAKLLGLRVYGFYYENKSDYKRAIDYYLQTLYEAQKRNDIQLEVSALTDQAVVYTEMNQPQKAKEVFQACISLNKQLGDIYSLVNTYTNLGPIYNHLGLYDSALFFLQEGLRIGKPLEEQGRKDLSNLYNNLGNTWYYLKNFDKALVYFLDNYRHDLSGNSTDKKDNLWFDEINMTDCYSQKGWFDSAGKYGRLSLDLAMDLGSKSKQSYTYKILSQLARNQRDYKRAWEYQDKWYGMDTAIVNSETNAAIAELEKKYETRQRENEKLLLQSEIAQQRFHNRIMMVMAISLLLVALVAAMAFMVKRNVNRKLQVTNDLIMHQNDRLSELNYEKNSLISIVSHDLSTPFASIGMWHQLLQDDQENLTGDQKKALDRIGQATRNGENLIRNILDVEKAQTNQHMMQLEQLDLPVFTESILENFQPAAIKKNIQLHLGRPSGALYFLSDRQLLGRMMENLLSNAIKYTSSGKNVWINLSEEKDSICITVQDEGVGIEPDELPRLFSKYSKISSQPTGGELSTGLGLSIVKRICEELNGQVSCESAPGKGSVFTVILKK